MKTLFVCIVLCIAASAQDAVVVELSKPDAEQAKQLYEAKIAADKAWDKAYDKIVGQYQGFASGVEFSKDFRFIVPKYATSGNVIWGGSGTITALPSVCGNVWTSPATPTPNQYFSITPTGELSGTGSITR